MISSRVYNFVHMERLNIATLIGESTEYDKKVMLEERRPKSWCKSISAFANGIGGCLVFGIADNGDVVGLENAKRDSEVISEIVKTHMNPIPNINMRFYTTDDNKTLLILDVQAGNETPYYYEDHGALLTFMRIGNETVPVTSAKLKELVMKGSNKSYDSLPSSYSFNNLAFTKLKSVYKQRTTNTFEDTDYESFGIIDLNDNLTNAGALLADESPVRHSRVFCTRWNGLDKAGGLIDAIDDEEYSGSLITLLQESLGFVRRNSKKAWRKTGDGRIEYPEYPETAVLEGIVNAIIHRDYLEIGSEVHIDMFDDRLEIYSPGGMFDGSRVQDLDLMNVPSKRRNPVLADIFNRLKYMDRRGSGFKKILTDYKNQNNFKEELKPVFYSGFGSFTLTLFNLNYGIPELNGTQEERQDAVQVTVQDGTQNVHQGVLQGVHQGRQDTVQVAVQDAVQVIGNITLDDLLKYCKKPRTRQEMQNFCGLAGRNNFARLYIGPLVKEGKLRMTIPDKPNSKNQKYVS